MSQTSESFTITADQVANYVVCPESWRLKYLEHEQQLQTVRTVEGKKRRQDWVEKQDLSDTLRRYAKFVYLMLFLLGVIVFLLDPHRFGAHQIRSPAIPTEIYLLLILLGVLIFTWDLFDRKRRGIQRETGLGEKSEVISIKGSNYLPGGKLFDATLRLSSKPDALIKEESEIIPVDIRPMSKKVRDRHVVALLVHMRLIATLEHTSPPYGVLLLGKENRIVKIQNTPEKQRWLDALLDEMRSIIDGIPAVPAPGQFKCKHCDVRSICEHVK